MHIFLTGKKGIGKSTVIQRVLSIMNTEVSGFITKREALNGRLNSKWGQVKITSMLSEKTYIVARWVDGKRKVFPYAFNSVGTLMMEEKGGKLVLMDELGFLEEKADIFKGAVLQTLDNEVPVLGAIRDENDSRFLNQVRKHKKVKIIAVTEENRDSIHEEVLSLIFSK